MNGALQLSVAALLLLADVACTEQETDLIGLVSLSIHQDSYQQWKLPSRLREISGLAMTPDGRLLAMDDERAMVYEIDYASGRLIKQFAFGKPVLRGDFEGIAYAEGQVFLITSGGVLYAAPEGAAGERVEYRQFDTGLGDKCEIEGLAQDPERRRLLLICKKMTDDNNALAGFVWQLPEGGINHDERFELPVGDIMAHLRTTDLNPSGIAIHPSTGSMLIVAARQGVVIEIDRQGKFVGAISLQNAKRHRQAEGIEISPAGNLLIADEGGRSRARLAVYRSVDVGTKNPQ